ncbi:hypothetical protein ABK16_21935 [Vibrio parahaemolyticus]|uniref:reverse transcriptase domain-containing protein n=1 Tax=Vibrio parahaemolyticus TaxID=670 RepID=UPI00073E7897|nr:reverse transcriptase domain-containing protein [Vibrio parahaemolyticus]KUH59814.1 hypothetical protein ABK16_21935 [Vibrio parahaemolyticus]
MYLNIGWKNRFEVKPGTWVYEPTLESKKYGRELITQIRKKWKAPEYYYHLRDGGHVKALEKHTANNFFASLDIKDFFGSISRTRVTRTLKPLFGYDIARKLAKLSSVKNDGSKAHSHSIPYGYVQSPILASICLHKSTFGSELDSCFNDQNVTISVYVDDIVISSNDKKLLKHWCERLKNAAKRSKFTLNALKESPADSTVVAFNIEVTHNSMVITKERFKLLYEAYQNSQSIMQRKGIGGYVGTVNKSQARLLDL